MPGLDAYALYMVLYYLPSDPRTGATRYHWGLVATGSSVPKSQLMHATDEGKDPLDLWYQSRPVSDVTRSRTMAVVLKVADRVRAGDIDSVVSQVPLMRSKYLPRGEPRWTCRVWVKEALSLLEHNRVITLPRGVDTLERYAWQQADLAARKGSHVVLNRTSDWTGGTHGTVPMDIDYPDDPMDVDTSRSSRRGGTSYMDVDSSHRSSHSHSHSHSSHRRHG